MGSAELTRALIVEDDPVVARAVARCLLREGYTVSLAGSCRAARAAGRGFQIAVLDLDLPDGGGAQLAEALLHEGAVHTVVFYTGSLDVAERERAGLLGPVVDKGQGIEDVVYALGPFPSVPPASRLSPATRPRQSGARLTRVLPEEEAAAAVGVTGDTATSSRSSSRR